MTVDTTNLKCGQTVMGGFRSGDCGKPATAIGRALVRPRYGSKAAVKPSDLSEYDIKRHIYCNFHKGVEKRRKYSPATDADFFALDDEQVQPFLARLASERAKRNVETRKENERKAAEALVMKKNRNKQAWEDYYAEATLDAKEEHEPRWTGSVVRHELTWTMVPNNSRRAWDSFAVEVKYDDDEADAPWQDIDPAYIRLRSTATFTPAQARVVAEALLLAARKAEAVSAEAFAKRNAILEPTNQ